MVLDAAVFRDALCRLRGYKCVHIRTAGDCHGSRQGRNQGVSRKLATYVLGAEAPLAITRHGDTIGYFLPARRKRTEEEKAAFREAAARMQEEMARVGATEDQILEDFEEMRRQEKNVRRSVA